MTERACVRLHSLVHLGHKLACSRALSSAAMLIRYVEEQCNFWAQQLSEKDMQISAHEQIIASLEADLQPSKDRANELADELESAQAEVALLREQFTKVRWGSL